MPRRAKRIRHEDGFSKGHEESTAQQSPPLSDTVEGAGDERANPAADYHLVDQLRHPTAQTLRRSAMQRLAHMGNQALLQRQQGPDAGVAEAGVDAAAQQAAMDTFLARGVLPSAAGKQVVGAGGIGGFNARWDPGERALIVSLKMGFKFNAGLVVNNAGVVSANTADLDATTDASRIARLQTEATRITAAFPNAADRKNEVDTNWTWSSGEKDPYMIQYEAEVMHAWSGQYFFKAKRFPDLTSNVRLELDIHEGHRPDDHVKASIIKSPVDLATGVVHSGSGTNAADQRMVLDSGDNDPNAASFLTDSIRFAHDSFSLDTAVGQDGRPARDVLDQFVTNFHAASPTGGVPITLTGHASADGSPEYNQKLSEKRSAAVETYMRGKGLRGAVNRLTSSGKGEEGATEDPEWRRVDLQVGSGARQTVGVHEFGHVIGLDDEYGAGFRAGANIGDATAHDPMARDMGGGVTGAPVENSDSIMSLGSTVKPQHYATFHHALEEVTGEEWELGGSARRPPIQLPATGGPNATPPPGTATA